MIRKFQAYDPLIHSEAYKHIAHGALTNSKRPETFIKGFYPTHLSKARGAHAWDTLGNRYVDFICGLGTHLIGAASEDINRAIIVQMAKGTTFSLSSDIEVQAAEKIKEVFPCIEKLRFLKTGSEACSAAIRIARAYTGRPRIISEGYHGWSDEFVSLTPPHYGVRPKGQIEPLCGFAFPDDTAAVIVEPVITEYSEGRAGWLRSLREICTKRGILLIFDEIITGLRFPTGSVASHFGVKPDLICLGKAIGGGLPLAVVGGRAEVMECNYFVSSTHAGETLSLAACVRLLDLLQKKYKFETLWTAGEQFQRAFNELGKDLIRLEGYPTRGVFQADKATKDLFFQECCRAGILVGPSFFFAYPHIEQVEIVLSTLRDVITKIRAGGVRLEGEPSTPPIAQTMREARGA